MRRQLWSFLVVLLCLLPQLGCLSTGQRTDTAALVGAPTDGNKPEPKLPPGKSAEICLHTAQTLEKNGHFAQAAGQYELAREYNPHLKNISRKLAVLYDRVGMDKQSLAEYQKALEESPRDPGLINNYGFYYYNRNKWKQAEEQFRKALALDNKHKAAWTNLGLTLAQQERYDESREAFRKVVGEAEALCNLALVLTTQGRLAEAREVYEKVLHLEPDMDRARLALAKLEAAASAPATPPNPLPPAARPGLKNARSLSKGETPAAPATPIPQASMYQIQELLPDALEADERSAEIPAIQVRPVGQYLLESTK